MKNYSALVAIVMVITFGLFGPLAGAECPALAGRYLCSLHSGDKIVEISQSLNEHITTYLIDGAEVVADGQIHPVTDNPTYRDGTYSARCEQDLLKINLDADFYNQDKRVGRMVMEMERGRGENNSLWLRNTGQLSGDFGNLPMKGEGLCRTL